VPRLDALAPDLAQLGIVDQHLESRAHDDECV
jgi:hypothetical protein